MRAEQGGVRLTARGRHAVAFGVLTQPRWWNALVKEIDQLNDQDEELGLQALDERIAGMQALRSGWYRIINNDEHWQANP